MTSKEINIFPHEWENKSKIVESRLRIKSNQGCPTKIFARKTKLSEISYQDAKVFLEHTHIQGVGSGSSVYLGLFVEDDLGFSDELVEVMTFGKSRFSKKYEWELIRLSTQLDTIVSGGASKLFKHFINNYTPKSIVSYSDNRWNEGSVYEKIGMTFSHASAPNYFYRKGDLILTRIRCQRHKLESMGLEKYDPAWTEKQIMLANGFEIVKDEGNKIYIWIQP